MGRETTLVRAYFALFLAGIVGFAVWVAIKVQSDIAMSTVSQNGLSVQLAVNGFCAIQFTLVQSNIWAGKNISVDTRQVARLR